MKTNNTRRSLIIIGIALIVASPGAAFLAARLIGPSVCAAFPDHFAPEQTFDIYPCAVQYISVWTVSLIIVIAAGGYVIYRGVRTQPKPVMRINNKHK